MLTIKKKQIPILVIFSLMLLFFSIKFILGKNYEFLIYVLVIGLIFLVILASNKKINYPNFILWLLATWGFLHFSGSAFYINGTKLYELMVIELVGEPYKVFKYDQFVHMFGFFTATLTLYYVLKPAIKKGTKRFISLSVIIVMAGLGAGALNEILEFIPTIFFETGVGGYENNAIDLIANLIGALIALVMIWKRDFKMKQSKDSIS
jgi:hypothetical protein